MRILSAIQLLCVLTPLMLTYSNSGHASRAITTNGFLTAAFSQVDSEVPFMGGLNDEINFSQGSLIGLQTTFRPSTDPFEFVVQLLALGEQSWEVNAEWAYVAYRPTDQWEFKFGKSRYPLYELSQSIHVGITYPWVRPPEEIYFLPYLALNGVNITRKINVSDYQFMMQIYHGELNEIESNLAGLVFDIDRMIATGAVLRVQSDYTSLRTSYHALRSLRVDTAAILANNNLNLADLGTAIATLNIPVPGEYQSADTYTFSVTHRIGNLEFRGEWVHQDLNEESPLPDAYLYYTNFSYQIGHFIPHITYSVYDTKNRALVNLSQESVILGLRVNINPSVALKIETGQFNIDDDASAVGLYDTLPNPIGSALIDKEVILFNAALSMVF